MGKRLIESIAVAAALLFADTAFADHSTGGVQLWEGGPYWAETNIGAEEPWDYGLYFWWGDTVGYRREGDAWVASDGSSTNFSFEARNTPTYNRYKWLLMELGWVEAKAEYVLTSAHDAAQVQWGGRWRMPTKSEMEDGLLSKCDWTWTTTNGVNGYIVRGRDNYGSAVIFLPAAGHGGRTSLYDAGTNGYYWSSVPRSDGRDYYDSMCIQWPYNGLRGSWNARCNGYSIRPVKVPTPLSGASCMITPTDNVYDGQPKEASVTVTIGGTALVRGSDYDVSYLDNVNAGTAKVIVNGSGNYTGAITNTFTIFPRPLTIKAAAKSKTYGASDPALTYTATGLVSGDSVSGALVRDAGENVGTYAIRQGTLTAGNNYAISYTGANLTITKKALAITAAAKSKTYGASDPALTYTATGLVGSDKVTGALVRDTGENVGTYAIKQGTLTAGNNYAISYTGANLTINKKALAVTAAAKSKTYGASDPALTYTATGLVGSDQVTGSLVRDAGEAVGTYAIRQGTLTAGNNYTISYTGADFTIMAPANAVWYVDATNGVDTADGFSWATAKKTIQAAVNLAVDGNQIIVTNGVYTKTDPGYKYAVVWNRNNTRLHIRSVNGPEVTIIDGMKERRCTELSAREEGQSSDFAHESRNDLVTMEGFTLRNGLSPSGGAGLLSGTLRHGIVEGCFAVTRGAVFKGIVENTLIRGNVCSNLTTFSVVPSAAYGSILINCTVSDNESRTERTSAAVEQCVLVNSIVYGNRGYDNPVDWEVASSVSTNSCSVGHALTGTGNILLSDSPFIDAAHGDYRLSATSPCIDAGDSSLAPAGTDLDGNPRVIGRTVDMGCYERQSIDISGGGVVVSLAQTSFTYDGTAHKPAATVTYGGASLVLGRDFSVSYEDNIAAGAARAIVSGLGVFEGTVTKGFEIMRRPVTVSVTGHTATYIYDTTAKTVTGYDAATADALYDIATGTVFGGTATASRSDVGTTAMGLKAGDFSNRNANFSVTYAVTDGGMTITPRMIGDDPANWDIRLGRAAMYDGTEQSAPIIQVCYVKPDGNLDYIPYTLSGNKATDAGNYVVRITGTGNYAGSVDKDWAITQRNVTLTSGSATWKYNGASHSKTSVTVSGDGFVEGEGATYSGFPSVKHVADAATPRANSFTYALNADTKAGNYVFTMVNGTVQVLPRAITLTAPTKEKNYDGQALTFSAAEVAVSGDGYAAGELFALGGFSSITEAGRADATFTVADGTALTGDYAITVVPGTLTVKKSAQEITVTARSGSWTYDGQSHVLHDYDATNLGTLVAGDQLVVTFDASSTVLRPTDGPRHDGVVANVITGVKVMRGGTDVTANYTLACYPGTLTVTKRPVTLTSKSATKAYDGQPLTAHEATVGGAGFVGTDGATYSFSGSQTDKGSSKNAFGYTLTAGTPAACYVITKVEGDLVVTAADVSGGGDGDWAIVLGPSLTYTGLEQIQTLASVSYKGLAFDYSVTGNAQTDAGAYTMTLVGQGNFTGEKTVAWSIARKALTLTAGSGSRVYDGTPFTVNTVTASGFVAGEGATYDCEGSRTDVGSSPNAVGAIHWNANTKASNYAVTKVAGTLAVTKRPVTLTAANISKPYDGTPLALTAADISAEGLVAGESFTYSGFASRTEAGQTPATFTYAAGAGTKLGNYDVSVTPGRTITIMKSATAISVTAASETWTYDGEAHSNRTWTATNLSTLQSGDALDVTFDANSTVLRPTDGPRHDGVVTNGIVSVRVLRGGSVDVTANYTVEWFSGTLAVVKRPVTVAVAGHLATNIYDGTAKTVTGYDATTADALYDIASDTVFGGTATASRTSAGTTAMGLTAADFTNRNGCFEVSYAVADGGVTIAPADISTGSDGDFAITLGAEPKYNGTVQTIPVTSVTYKGLDIDYTLAGENATHAGTYVLTVKGRGNFTGERSTTWRMLKRQVTLTSGGATKPYDGTALTRNDVSVGGDGFIGLEGATFTVTGSQTVVGTGKNTFSYTLKAGTLASDYDITRVEGDLIVIRATLPPSVIRPGWDGETPLVCEKVFNGEPQPVEIVPDFDEPYTILWSLTDQSASASPSFQPSAPTRQNVADGEITAYFKFVTDYYEPIYGSILFRIVPKALTGEMVVLTDEVFFYDPESGQKTPSVTVTDTNAIGDVISTMDDYEIAYGDSTGAGAVPVIATGMNNYTGTVTKTFPVLKRPVKPPTIGSKPYNGRTQRATVPSDNRWTVVENPGGINAGFYTNVVLHLTTPDDYKWAGCDDDETDWTGVFEIRRAGNGWSTEPAIADWTEGETPPLPNKGQPRLPRNGDQYVHILYRVRGADPETGTETIPTRAGLYTARFVVDETANYAGTYQDVNFEIHRAEGDDKDHTETTGVPVPHAWLDPYLEKYGNGDYEAAGNARGLNGCFLWESYLAGLDPENPHSRFMAFISMQADGSARITWHPDLSKDAEEPRIYTVLGKASLADRDWTPVTDENKAQMRFFKVKVELP